MERVQLLIIGGGPSGLAVGIEAQKAGLDFVILEKGVLIDSIYHFPTNMTFFSTSQLLEIGDVPFISHSDKPTRREALEYYRRVREQWQLPVHFFEEVQGMQPAPDGRGYVVESSRKRYHTDAVVVATGFYGKPRLMNVPGEDLPKVTHYYEEAHPYVGQKVLVVGAANSACDVALETYHKGAKVTMAIRGEEIHTRVKYWIRPNIINRIKEGSIQAYFRTEVKEIREREVVLQGPEGVFSIGNDFVLAMTGYKPDYPLLRKLGITFEEDEFQTPRHDPATLETNLPNVFLAGVIAGGMKTNKLFIENTRHHGQLIVSRVHERLRAAAVGD